MCRTGIAWFGQGGHCCGRNVDKSGWFGYGDGGTPDQSDSGVERDRLQANKTAVEDAAKRREDGAKQQEDAVKKREDEVKKREDAVTEQERVQAQNTIGEG